MQPRYRPSHLKLCGSRTTYSASIPDPNRSTSSAFGQEITMPKGIRVAMYLRVSTVGHGQTTKNQRRELEVVAKRQGWSVVGVFEDAISGAKGRDKRPGLDALLKGVARRDFEMVAAWSVDRLG